MSWVLGSANDSPTEVNEVVSDAAEKIVEAVNEPSFEYTSVHVGVRLLKL